MDDVRKHPIVLDRPAADVIREDRDRGHWVIEASIAVKLPAAEPDSELYRTFVGEFPASHRLLAPSLLRFEVGNALTRQRRLPHLDALLTKALAPIEILDPMDIAGRQEGLSYHDAAYLALAIEQKAGLLAADDGLRRAAKRHRLPVEP